MFRKSTIFTILFLASLAPINSWCQNNNDRPKEFYNNDFAESTFQKDKTQSNTIKKTSKSSSSSEINSDNSGTTSSDPSFTELENKESEEASIPSQNEEKPINAEKILKVHSIGLIVNSDDKEHAIEKLGELTDLATKHDWTIGAIYAIGDLANLALSKEMRMLRVRGALLTKRDSIPKRYESVKLSPTWLISTEEGEVILEATGSLKRHFNSNGKFLLPKQRT